MAKEAFGTTRSVVACLGVAGGLLAWGLTTRPMLLGLDWDSAFHLWEIDRLLTRGRDGCGLGNTLWTCGYTAHMALEPLYGLAASATRTLSGDPLDGLRMVNALAVGLAAVYLALVIRRTGAAIPATMLTVLAWLLTADVLFLIRTVEDDCLSLAWMSGLLFWCTRAPARWNVVTALLGGFVLGASALTNYPMLVWAPVVIATALFYVRPDTPLLDRRRLLWSGAIVAGFSLSIVLWGVWVTSYDESWTWTRYGESLVTSPNQGLFERAGRVDLFLGYVTKYPLDTIFPGGWYPGLLLERSTFLTWFIPLNIAGLLIFGIVWPFRNGEPTAAGRVVSLSCLALFVCTIPAAWKNDSAQYERMNHVPLCLAVLAGFALGKTDTDWRRVARGLVAAVVVAVPLINSGAVLREARGQSWLARFDAMRISAPRRMTFVFAESEFGQGDFDKLASLHFALPNHLVLSPAGDIRHWPFTPVNHVLLDEYLSVPPDWRNLSPAAAALLESRRSSATLERLSR